MVLFYATPCHQHRQYTPTLHYGEVDSCGNRIPVREFGAVLRHHSAPSPHDGSTVGDDQDQLCVAVDGGAGGSGEQYPRQVVSYLTPLSVHIYCRYHVAILLCSRPRHVYTTTQKIARDATTQEVW